MESRLNNMPDSAEELPSTVVDVREFLADDNSDDDSDELSSAGSVEPFFVGHTEMAHNFEDDDFMQAVDAKPEVNIDDIIEEIIGSSNQEKLEKLQATLKDDKRHWKASLRAYINIEVEAIFDSEKTDRDARQSAMLNFLNGDVEHFTADKSIAEDFVNLQDLLTIQTASSLYVSLVDRDENENNELPSVEEFKLAALHFLEEMCEDLGVTISEETKLKIVFEQPSFFIPGKEYSLDELSHLFKKLMAPFNVKLEMHTQSVLLHALLLYAGIQEFPRESYITQMLSTDGYHGRNIYAPGYFYAHFALPETEQHKIQRFYKCKSAELLDANKKVWCVNTNNIVELLYSPPFKEFLATQFSNPGLVENYNLYNSGAKYGFGAVVSAFTKIGNKYHLDCTSCDFVEASIAYGFGVREELKGAHFKPASRFDNFATHTDFYLALSAEAVKNMIIAINMQFPKAATLIETGTHLPVKGNTLLQRVAIRNSVLVSKEFQHKCANALDVIAKTEIDLFDSLEIAAGVKTVSTRAIKQDLSQFIQEFKETDSRLSGVLSALSLFAPPASSPQSLDDVSFEVNKSLDNHQANCATLAEYGLFKEGPRKKIEAIEFELERRQSSRREMK